MTEYHQEAAEFTDTAHWDRTFERVVCGGLDGESESHQQYIIKFHHKIPETIRNLCKTVIKNDNNTAR